MTSSVRNATDYLRTSVPLISVSICLCLMRAASIPRLVCPDPNGSVFSHRLYREHCTPLEGCYTKDLRTLGRDLSSTILVENTPLSFCYQPSNAILVPTWTCDDADTELLSLITLYAHGVSNSRLHTAAPTLDCTRRLRSLTAHGDSDP